MGISFLEAVRDMKRFGFGCMRLPMLGGEVDTVQFKQMVDAFLRAGFRYFDTAHGYISEKSEPAIRECLVERYPRDTYFLTNKLSGGFFQSEADIAPLFEKQLKQAGVTYFDCYLLHALTEDVYNKYSACNAFEAVKTFKAQGKVNHIGISFHDTAKVLDQILSEHPEIEVVQIQFNYADYDDPGVQSRAVYETCVKHNKPVIVMEPVKGGALADLTPDARAELNALSNASPASYAIRFAASFPNVAMVLSGMSTLNQALDNIAFMQNFIPITDAERAAIDRVNMILKKQDTIACTGCRYCVDGCPVRIPIPDLFACMNSKTRFGGWNSHFYYNVYTQKGGKASDCVSCGQCENACPQHLPIRELLKKVAEVYEKEDA